MELGEALTQIEAIRAQVARTKLFRGYRAVTVGSTGVLAFAAALTQRVYLPNPAEHVIPYLQLWIGVAAVSVLCVGFELAKRYRRTPSPLQREQTLQAVENFLPCVVAGACVTWGIVRFAPEAATLLPGLWGILFSLGVFASRRQLPPSATLVAVYYLVSGVICLALARGEHAFSPWAMAGTFGVGQLLTAVVLYYGLERTDGRRETH